MKEENCNTCISTWDWTDWTVTHLDNGDFELKYLKSLKDRFASVEEQQADDGIYFGGKVYFRKDIKEMLTQLSDFKRNEWDLIAGRTGAIMEANDLKEENELLKEEIADLKFENNMCYDRAMNRWNNERIKGLTKENIKLQRENSKMVELLNLVERQYKELANAL